MASSDYSGPSSPNGNTSPIPDTNSSPIRPTPTSRRGRRQRQNPNSSPIGSSSPNGNTSPIPNTNSSPVEPTPSTRDGRRQRANPNSSPFNYQTPPVPSSSFSTPSSRRRRGPHFTPATPSTPASSNAGDDDAAMDDDAMDSAPVFVWGTNISVQDVNSAILRFLRHFRDPQQSSAVSADMAMEEGKYMRMVHRIMELDGGESLDVDAHDVFDHDPDLYGKMVRYPLEVLAIFDIVLMDMVARIDPLFEKHIHTRIYNLKSSVSMRNSNPSGTES